MEDKAIIHLYHQRNEIALTETASKYGKLLYSVAKGALYSREDSEEVVNDSYHGAWTSMPPNKPDSLTAFLCRITRNLPISDKVVFYIVESILYPHFIINTEYLLKVTYFSFVFLVLLMFTIFLQNCTNTVE